MRQSGLTVAAVPEPPAPLLKADMHSIQNEQQTAARLMIRCAGWQQGQATMGPFVLQVRGAERIAILGPSGAGKSSLLKALSGDLPALHKSVFLNGEDLQQYSAQALAEHRAVLMQSHQMAFSLPVELVISLGRIARDADSHQQEFVRQAAQLAEAAHLLPRQYNSLSGGEQARVQLARVFAQLWDRQGAIILVDEPVSALDPGLQSELLHRLQQFASERHHAVIAVLHDVNQALQYFERLWMIRDGQLMADCPATLQAVPQLEQLYQTGWQVLRSADGETVLHCIPPHRQKKIAAPVISFHCRQQQSQAHQGS